MLSKLPVITKVLPATELAGSGSVTVVGDGSAGASKANPLDSRWSRALATRGSSRNSRIADALFADAADLHELLQRRSAYGCELAEVGGQVAGDGRSHLRDAQADQKPGQLHALAAPDRGLCALMQRRGRPAGRQVEHSGLADRLHQLACGELGEAGRLLGEALLEPDQLLGLQVEEVRQLPYQARPREQRRVLLPQPLDIQGATGCEVDDPTLQLGPGRQTGLGTR